MNVRTPSSKTVNIRYQLRVGILGGGPAADQDALCRAVKARIGNIMGRLRDRDDSTPVDWVVVSSLSDRTSMCLTECALQSSRGRLELILEEAPAELRGRLGGCGGPTDARRLDELLGVADRRWRTVGAAPLGAAARLANEQIVDSCEIVLAVCGTDGDAPIARALAYAVRAGRLVLRLDPAHPDSRARVARLTRRGETATMTVERTRLVDAPVPKRRPLLSLGFVRISAFNRGCASDAPEVTRRLAAIRREVGEAAERAGLDREFVRPMDARLLLLGAKADVLAERHQARYRLGQLVMHALAAVAVTIGAGQVLLLPLQKWILLFELLAMLLSMVVLWFIVRGFVHDRWLYSRYLAEQLRSARFTLPLGCRAEQDDAAPSWSLPLFAGADSHLSAAIWREMEAARAACPVTADSFLDPLRRFVVDGWIVQQMDWHEENARRKHHREHRSHFITLTFLVATALAVSLYLLWYWFGPEVAADTPSWADPGPWLKLVAIAAPAWAAAHHGFSRPYEDRRIARRSEELSHRLAQIVARAEAAPDITELRSEATRAADIMAAELQDWLVQISFHPPEPVV